MREFLTALAATTAFATSMGCASAADCSLVLPATVNFVGYDLRR